MAQLNHNRARSTVTLYDGPVKCNPETGRLAPVADPPLKSAIGIELGPFRIWFERSEFLEHADKLGLIAKLIRAAE